MMAEDIDDHLSTYSYKLVLLDIFPVKLIRSWLFQEAQRPMTSPFEVRGDG